MATCYQTDPEGYYVGVTDDFGGYTPSGAVYIEPHIVKGAIPKWDGKAWQQVESHMGETGYVNGVSVTITQHGSLPDGWSDTPPEPTPEEKAQKRMAEIDAEISTLEQKALRPILAIETGLDEVYDHERKKELVEQIIDLRCERQMIEASYALS